MHALFLSRKKFWRGGEDARYGSRLLTIREKDERVTWQGDVAVGAVTGRVDEALRRSGWRWRRVRARAGSYGEMNKKEVNHNMNFTTMNVFLLLVAMLFFIPTSNATINWIKSKPEKAVTITNNHTNFLSIRCFSFDTDLKMHHLRPWEGFGFKFRVHAFFPASTMFNCSTNMGAFTAFRYDYDCASSTNNRCDWRFDLLHTYRFATDIQDWELLDMQKRKARIEVEVCDIIKRSSKVSKNKPEQAEKVASLIDHSSPVHQVLFNGQLNSQLVDEKAIKLIASNRCLPSIGTMITDVQSVEKLGL
ncbi:hypothetical protein LguiA_033886 [Lonicera macranthoides]